MSMIRKIQYKQNFIFSNRVMKFVLGLYPYQNANHLLFQWCTLTIYIFPLIGIQFYQIFMSDIKSQVNLNMLQKLLSGACVCFTYSICYFRFDTIKKLFTYTKRDYQQYFSKKELCLVEKYTKQIKLYRIIFMSFVMLYSISLMIPSIFNVILHIFGLLDDIHLTLPFPVKNILNSGLLYYSVLIYEIIAIFAIFIISSIIYPMFLITVQHACLQFSILMFKIRQPFNNNKYKLNDSYDEIDQLEWEWIVDIINCYAKVTKYVYLINTLSKTIFLFGIAFSMILILFDLMLIMQLSVTIQNLGENVENFITIFGSVTAVYITFYTGQMLINHSTQTYYELCQIPFYMLSIKTQKLLLFLIAKNIKPCEVSIGGIFTASHKTFASVVQKAFSFAMVYYNML